MNVSHLPFVDEDIVFCDNDYDHMLNLNYVLTWFEAFLDMRINLVKSSILPLCCLLVFLGRAIDSWFTTFLGLPLGLRFKEKSI